MKTQHMISVAMAATLLAVTGAAHAGILGGGMGGASGSLGGGLNGIGGMGNGMSGVGGMGGMGGVGAMRGATGTLDAQGSFKGALNNPATHPQAKVDSAAKTAANETKATAANTIDNSISTSKADVTSAVRDSNLGGNTRAALGKGTSVIDGTTATTSAATTPATAAPAMATAPSQASTTSHSAPASSSPASTSAPNAASTRPTLSGSGSGALDAQHQPGTTSASLGGDGSIN